MFGRRGNPNARNPLAVIDHLQRASGIEVKVETRHWGEYACPWFSGYKTYIPPRGETAPLEVPRILGSGST
jgi:hypothetical protein